MKIYALELCAVIALLICIGVGSTAEFEMECQEIRQDVLRLHVLANSDSDTDQNLKLEVRDEILLAGKECFCGADDIDVAKVKIQDNLSELAKVAQETIERNGFDYEVSVSIEKTFFPTRSYEDVSLPAGIYEAVRVVIGSGSGHNWWCVMFPPMCLPAAQGDKTLDDVLDEEGKELVESSPKFELRFWIVEQYQKFKEKLKSNDD